MIENRFCKIVQKAKYTGFLFALLLSVALMMSSCEITLYPFGTGEGEENYKDNLITVENGYLSTGSSSGSIKYGKSFTVYSNELPGMYFDHWTKNGERIEGGEELRVTADIKSKDESPEVNYCAIYKRSEAAEFEDVPFGSFYNIYSNNYNVRLSANSENITAEIIKDPSNPKNNILKYVDNDSSCDGVIDIGVAWVQGDFLAYSLDFFVESYLGSVPLSIKMGNYTVDFYSSANSFKVCDSGEGIIAYLRSEFDLNMWHNFTVYVSNTAVNGNPPHSYLFLDGDCIAESYNATEYSFADNIGFYTSGQGQLVAYLDNISAYRLNLTPSEELAMEPSFVLEKGYKNTDAYYQAEMVLDSEALAALKAMDKALFSEDIYRWIADLYDPETSALYFSISGRDNYGYLPDIETVAQGYGILSTLGIGNALTVLNAEQRANLLSWIQTLQSNRDGYYYHPHWGVSINNSRLSRDLGNSSSSYSPSGGSAYRLFDDANYRLSGGAQGNQGITTPFVYDNSLTVMLTSSAAKQVSKLLLTSSMSSMPHHLRSEENLVRHINDRWNSTCTLSGTHERHFCADSCVIVEDTSDSYMKIEDGKLVITRGGRCTSCHECRHTLGHSYGFGHYVTSMGSQIKAAGLGKPTVMYFYDIQENVQAALRDKAEDEFISENGQAAWDSLSENEKTLIRKSAENGVWEEKITYNTISGLLKICGIPGTHGFEFLYAEAAINSAIEGALFSTEDFISRRESIVSIYNPFNAINGIMNNIKNYGKDPSVRVEAMALVRQRAKELIDNTAVKLACYLMPDGGYSYNMSGYCTESQGQPVAVSGWNNGVGEGDVNGTALALGTRSALLSCLGLDVGAPFSGERSKYSEDGYDLDGDGIISETELEATHTDVFKSLINGKSEIEKKEGTVIEYTFEGEKPNKPTEGNILSEGGNNVLEVVDSVNGKGVYADFGVGKIAGSEDIVKFKLDMKVKNCNNSVSHQIFVDSGILRIDLTYENGLFTFANVAGGTFSLVDKDSGKPLSVNALSWFTVEADIYTNGKMIDGTTRYGIFTLSQNGVKQTAYINRLPSYGKNARGFRIYSLSGSVNTAYYDNVSCAVSVAVGVYDGEYNFDSVSQQISDKITASPTNTKDKVLPILSGNTESLKAHQYSTSQVIYDFDFLQGSLYLGDANVNDKIYYTFKDSSGKSITGIILEINEDKTVSVYAANGQSLKMANPERNSVADPLYADMTLDADLSKWLVIKLEYHHDMSEPQFDIVLRYSDISKDGFNKTVAATLMNTRVLENGARADDFTELEIEYSSANDGKIYIDDLYIRNVYKP